MYKRYFVNNLVVDNVLTAWYAYGMKRFKNVVSIVGILLLIYIPVAKMPPIEYKTDTKVLAETTTTNPKDDYPDIWKNEEQGALTDSWHMGTR